MGGMSLKLTPVIVRHLSDPLGMFGPMLALLGLIASPNSANGGHNPLWLSTLPHHPPHPLICANFHITVVVSFSESSSVS